MYKIKIVGFETPKFGPGGETTDGCPANFYKNAQGKCVPNVATDDVWNKIKATQDANLPVRTGTNNAGQNNKNIAASINNTFNTGNISQATNVRTDEKVKGNIRNLNQQANQQAIEDKKQEDIRVKERLAAKDFNEGKTKTFTLPNDETKTLDQMNWRERQYVAGKSLESKGRFFENEESLIDGLNPLSWIAGMAGALGEAPYQAKQSGSNMPYVSAILNPLLMGRMMGSGSMNPLGKKLWTNEISNAEFLNSAGMGIPGMTKDLTKGTLNFADRHLSDVGRNLAKIQKEGKVAGLNPFEIAQMQMEKVGITSNQRQAYRPILSNLAEKYITPYGYQGGSGQSKLKEIIKNIKQGGLESKQSAKEWEGSRLVSDERSDAWKLYLGKPQQYNTFKIAETAPVNHPSYSPKQLANMDIYSINSKYAKQNITPDISLFPEVVTNREIKEGMDLLRNKINIDKGNEIMGGYNRRLNQYGLEYNDIWDLNPNITLRSLFPKVNAENPILAPLFYKKINGLKTSTPRGIKIPVDKFIGKPFMSHEVLPYTSNDLKQQLNNVFDIQLEKSRPWSDRASKVKRMEEYKEELKNYPKFTYGGPMVDYMSGKMNHGEMFKQGGVASNEGYYNVGMGVPRFDDGGQTDPFGVYNTLHKKGDFSNPRQSVINTMSNLPIYSPDVRYQEYKTMLPEWKAAVENVPIETGKKSPHAGSSYYGYGAPSFSPEFAFQGSVQLDPNQFDNLQTPDRVISHELRHAGFDGSRYIPQSYGDALYTTARHPEGFERGAHQDMIQERAAMNLGTRQAMLERFGLPSNAKIPRKLFDTYNRETMETSLRQGHPIDQFSDVDETFKGARNASDVYDLVNFNIPKEKNGGDISIPQLPKANSPLLQFYYGKLGGQTTRNLMDSMVKPQKKRKLD